MTDRPLAVVTGASSGIGLELARLCAERGHDLVIAAHEPQIETVAEDLRREAVVRVEAVKADLATPDGIDALCSAIARTGRPVAALLANAGRGVGGDFLDQHEDEIRHVVATNVTGTLVLVHRIGRAMRDRGEGRILITGSIAGYVPGPYMAVYNASKAFIDSFAQALRQELDGSGVTVTCMMPGLSDTRFFERAGMQDDTRIGRLPKDDPQMVARKGYEALMRGDSAVATGAPAKVQTYFSGLVPERLKARLYAPFARPDGR